jgi:hypothetical protein
MEYWGKKMPDTMLSSIPDLYAACTGMSTVKAVKGFVDAEHVPQAWPYESTKPNNMFSEFMSYQQAGE